VKRPRLLMLGFQFPPGRGSGVYRIRAWANHFARRGWDVRVITVEPSYWEEITGSPDRRLLETVDSRVHLDYVKFPHEYLKQDHKSMSWLHANFAPAYLKFWRSMPQRMFPEVYGHLYPLMAAKAIAIGSRWRPDVVLASGNPYAQYASAWAAGRALRVPYVVDYHDPWTLDLWTEQDAFPPDHAAWKWERRILDHAALTVTVNRPLVQWYQQRYPEIAGRVRLVELGFDDTVVTDPGFVPRAIDEPLHFGFVGTIRQDLPLEEFLDGWALARQEPEMRDALMTFYGYLGFFQQHAKSIEARLMRSAPEGIEYGGPVSQTDLSATYAELDALAMLLTSSRFVTAGKGYDYMASGRPVVGVHDPRNHTTEVFKPYPLFFGAQTVDAQGVRDALIAAARAAREQTKEQYDACRAEAMRHTWDEAIEPVAAEIESWRS